MAENKRQHHSNTFGSLTKRKHFCCPESAQAHSRLGDQEGARSMARASLAVSGVGVVVGIAATSLIIWLNIQGEQDVGSDPYGSSNRGY